MTEFFKFLVETNLANAAFVIGAIAVILAIIGSIKAIIELPPTMRLLLAAFGIGLMALSLGGFFFSFRGEQSTPDEPTRAPTESPAVQPVNPTTPPRISPTGTRESVDSAETLPPSTSTTAQIVIATGAPSNCIADAHTPLAQGDHFFQGPVHVLQLWRQGGDSPWGSGEVMSLVTGDVSIVAAGGSVWTYPASECETVARIHMQDGANARGSIVVTPEELRAAGMIN